MQRLLLALGLLTSTAGCSASPSFEEERASTTQQLSGCELFAGATGIAVTAFTASSTASVACGEAAAAATVVTGGVAAAGSVICIAPLAGVALSTLAGAVATAGAYLTCSSKTSSVRPAEDATDASRYQGQSCAKKTSNTLYDSYKSYCAEPRSCKPSDSCAVLEERVANASKCYEARKKFMDVCEQDWDGSGENGTPEHRAEAEKAKQTLLDCQDYVRRCNVEASSAAPDPDFSG